MAADAVLAVSSENNLLNQNVIQVYIGLWFETIGLELASFPFMLT